MSDDSSTTPHPGDPIWDTAWIPAAAGWLESVDAEDAWVVNHPPAVDVGDAAVCWSAELSELRPRLKLASPDDGYCRQCLGITVMVELVKCPMCGHGTHSNCVQAHRGAHAEFDG